MVSEYIEHLSMKGYSVATIKTIRMELKLYSSYIRLNFKKRIREADHEELEKYLKYLKRGMLKPKTIERKVCSLRGYYRYLKKRGCILTSPMEKVDIHFSKPSIPGFVPDEKDVEELLRLPDVNTRLGIRNRAILEVFYSSGLRCLELANLRLKDIDLRERVVYVFNGKGGKDRVIPLGREAAKWVEKYLEEVRPHYLRRATEESFFVTRTGKLFISMMISLMLKKYKQVSHLDNVKKITPHSLRHACALHMLRGGAAIEQIQKMLGHCRISSTQIYTRLHPKDLKEAHKKCHPREKLKMSAIAKY